MSSSRSNRRTHVASARHAGRRAQNRLHRHQTFLAPDPWGAIEMPITFSRGAYEAQYGWFAERTGVSSSFGGPVDGWCRCGAVDPRLRVPHRGRQLGTAAPYWQPPIDDETANAMRAAEVIREERLMEQWEERKARRAAARAAARTCPPTSSRS